MVQISVRPKVTLSRTSRLFIDILYIAVVVIVRTINSRTKKYKKSLQYVNPYVFFTKKKSKGPTLFFSLTFSLDMKTLTSLFLAALWLRYTLRAHHGMLKSYCLLLLLVLENLICPAENRSDHSRNNNYTLSNVSRSSCSGI